MLRWQDFANVKTGKVTISSSHFRVAIAAGQNLFILLHDNKGGSRFVAHLRRNIKTDLKQSLAFRVPEPKRIVAGAAISGLLNAHARIRKPHTMANDYTMLHIGKAANLQRLQTQGTLNVCFLLEVITLTEHACTPTLPDVPFWEDNPAFETKLKSHTG